MGKYDNIQKKRNTNIEVFKDTMTQIAHDPELTKCVENSVSSSHLYTIHSNGKTLNVPLSFFNMKPNPEYQETSIVVNKSRSIQAAHDIIKNHPEVDFSVDRIAVLNFASATTPGGGVVSGANAQEESICRITTLYPVLNTSYAAGEFYKTNRRSETRFYTNSCLYLKDIMVLKNDDSRDMRTLDSSERFMVDIITCPAPNLRTESHNRFNPDDVKTPINDTNNLEKVLTDRIGLILNTAVDNHAKYLVLGAFGCGAFKNPPALVAEVFKKLLNGKFEGYFKEVVFAIYCNKYNSENYEIFKEVFDK